MASLPITSPGSWVFSGDVPAVFVDHARHSVPFYDAGHDLVCDLSTCFLGGDQPRVGYELGSATGQLLHRLATHGPANHAAHWIGVDREAAMVKAARDHCAGLDNVEVVEGELTTIAFQECDFVVAYLTMHFLPPGLRRQVLSRICQALRPGGAFFMFDKVLAPGAQLEDLITTLHYRFKRNAGLSPEEILNKKESLLGVLQPVSTDDNLALLREAGFASYGTILKYLAFEGFIAIK
ncbi:methyltransferase domain-containing protein [Nonomuraea sp. NPDC004580]|uniref:methyltransferase domain-containing protein n=1 Tax=Nonomuraea sp. NPDC004580 TaxID=3154552 RepID=UPI0033B441DB